MIKESKYRMNRQEVKRKNLSAEKKRPPNEKKVSGAGRKLFSRVTTAD